jgi:hypothetical protein
MYIPIYSKFIGGQTIQSILKRIYNHNIIYDRAQESNNTDAKALEYYNNIMKDRTVELIYVIIK